MTMQNDAARISWLGVLAVMAAIASGVALAVA
jgi:hypothetical protein